MTALFSDSLLASESSTPTGFLLPAPQGEDADQDEEDDPLAAMKADLKTLAGGLALVETTAAGLDQLPRRHCVRSARTWAGRSWRRAESARPWSAGEATARPGVRLGVSSFLAVSLP